MWSIVCFTLLFIYLMFNHSPFSLIYSYLIHPVVCSVGLIIAGLIGKEYIEGRVILMGTIGAFSIFILIITIFVIIGGLGMIFWGAWLFLTGFNILLILGIVTSGLVHSK